MKKEKYHIEYVLNQVSRRSLWNHLTTSAGLSAWFADKVSVINMDKYTFYWNKEGQKATAIFIHPEDCIRFRWDEDKGTPYYFEFSIHYMELTSSTSLEITDFAEPDEKADAIDLWDSQIEVLKRTLGI